MQRIVLNVHSDISAMLMICDVCGTVGDILVLDGTV